MKKAIFLILALMAITCVQAQRKQPLPAPTLDGTWVTNETSFIGNIQSAQMFENCKTKITISQNMVYLSFEAERSEEVEVGKYMKYGIKVTLEGNCRRTGNTLTLDFSTGTPNASITKFELPQDMLSGLAEEGIGITDVKNMFSQEVLSKMNINSLRRLGGQMSILNLTDTQLLLRGSTSTFNFTREKLQKQEITVNGVTFTMIPVEGGTFTMGAHPNQASNAKDNEKPAHQVTLSGYYIGETEVTQALWTAVMGNNPSKFKGDDLPVESVSLDDCQIFINKLNSLTSKNFRLPTEAEWEYAARGGKKSKNYIYSGSNTIDNVAWYRVNSSEKTHPVKTKHPNELGLYDMTGNVDERCQDVYSDYSSGPQTNPICANSRDRFPRYIIRGGSWAYPAESCRSSSRSHHSSLEDGYLGLRIVLSE